MRQDKNKDEKNETYETELIEDEFEGVEDDDFEEGPENENRRLLIGVKPKRNKKLNFSRVKKILAAAVILVIICAGIIVSPVFDITKITVTELDRYTYSDICEMIGLKEGKNIFAFNKAKAEKILNSDWSVESAVIDIDLPGTVNVVIDERKVWGYVPYMGSYLYIDASGRVLDINDYFITPMPVVTGLDFTGFTLGAFLEVENSVSLDKVVELSKVITKYELNEEVDKIDVSDPAGLKVYAGGVEAYLGSSDGIDQKISTMAEIISQIPEGDRGTIDLSDLTKPIVFKYLT